MAGKPSIKRLPQSRVQCVVTFTKEEIEPLEESVLLTLGKDLRIEGFRPGNIPVQILRERVDREEMLQGIIHALMSRTLPRLIKEQNMKPIIPPRVQLTAENPLTLTLVFVEHPEVTMKGMKKVQIEKKEPDVKEEDVKRVLDYVLQQYAGQDKKAPELTDTFARDTLNMESADAFRKRVQESLIAQAKKQEEQRRTEALMQHIVEETKVDLAPELVEGEAFLLRRELEHRLKDANIAMSEWLRRSKKTEKELEEEFNKEAQRRLKLRFGLEQLLADRKIEISEVEMEKAAGEMLRELPESQRESAATHYKKGEEGYERLHWQLQVDKLFAELLA